jgi:anti-sigma B factor antagonist
MMPAPLTITSHANGDGVVRLAVAGEVDMSNSDTLRGQILAALEADQRPAELVIDLDQVRFLDSTGINVLVNGHRNAQDRHIDYRVIKAHDTALRVLEITGVKDILGITKSPDGDGSRSPRSCLDRISPKG